MKRNNGMIGQNDPPKSKAPGISGSNKNKTEDIVIDVVCCGYHTVVDTSLDNFLRNFKTDDGDFFVIGEGNILNKCEGFECVALPVSQCMIYEMKREDLNKANTNK